MHGKGSSGTSGAFSTWYSSVAGAVNGSGTSYTPCIFDASRCYTVYSGQAGKIYTDSRHCKFLIKY